MKISFWAPAALVLTPVLASAQAVVDPRLMELNRISSLIESSKPAYVTMAKEAQMEPSLGRRVSPFPRSRPVGESVSMASLVKAMYTHVCFDCHGYEPDVRREETFLVVTISACSEAGCLRRVQVSMLESPSLGFEENPGFNEAPQDFRVDDRDAAALSGPRSSFRIDEASAADVEVEGVRQTLSGDQLLAVLNAAYSAGRLEREKDENLSKAREANDRLDARLQELRRAFGQAPLALPGSAQ